MSNRIDFISSRTVVSPTEEPATRASTPGALGDFSVPSEKPSADSLIRHLRNGDFQAAKTTVSEYFKAGNKRKHLEAELGKHQDKLSKDLISLIEAAKNHEASQRKIAQEKDIQENSGFLAGIGRSLATVASAAAKVVGHESTPEEREKSLHQIIDLIETRKLEAERLEKDKEFAQRVENFLANKAYEKLSLEGEQLNTFHRTKLEQSREFESIRRAAQENKAKVERVERARKELGDALRALGKPTDGLEQVGRMPQEPKGVLDPALSTGMENKPFLAAASKEQPGLYSKEELEAQSSKQEAENAQRKAAYEHYYSQPSPFGKK